MFKQVLAATLAVVALAGCVSPRYVISDVTRFHSLPSSASGQTFVIATLDAEQGQSLAYRQFADTVTAKLTGMGLKPFSGPTQGADYVVTLRYSVRGPTPDIESRGGPSFGFGYGFGHRHSGFAGAYDSGWDHYTDTKQLFVRRVELDLYKGATYNSDKKERMFEGRALSTGVNGQLEPVIPYILDALFKDFPGRSGEAVRVSVQVPDNIGNPPANMPASHSSY